MERVAASAVMSSTRPAGYKRMIAKPLIRKRYGILFCLVLLAACRNDVTHADISSPNGDYHVVVKECPQRGSFFWSGDTSIQVSILPYGDLEACNTFINSVYQFDAYSPHEQLELEWTSWTELRAWHPGFDHNSWPGVLRSKGSGPIKVTFSPKAAPTQPRSE